MEFPTTLSRLNQKNRGRGLWITLLVKTSRKRTSAALLLFKKIGLAEQQNRTIHLLQNRTILFVDNRDIDSNIKTLMLSLRDLYQSLIFPACIVYFSDFSVARHGARQNRPGRSEKQ